MCLENTQYLKCIIKRYDKEHNNVLQKYLDEYTKDYLDDRYSINKKVYCVLKKFKELPRCQHCFNKILNLNNKGFRLSIKDGILQDTWPIHCCKNCARVDKNTRLKSINTTLKNFGVKFPTQNKKVMEKHKKLVYVSMGVRVTQKQNNIQMM